MHARSQRSIFAGALLSLAAFSASAAAPAAGDDLARWPWVAAVTLDANAPAGRWAQFELPLEVLSHARRGLGDLRLTDAAGNIVPHVIRPARSWPIEPPPAQPAKLIRRQSDAGRSIVTADFGAALARNRVEVLTDGADFLRPVKVEGSADGNSWRVLAEKDWLFRVASANAAYARSEVDLPANDCRYLRVSVSAGWGEQKPPTVKAVAARLVPDAFESVRAGAETEVPILSFAIYGNEEVSYVEYDLGFGKLPLSRLELPLRAGEPCFRQVEVLGRDTRTVAAGDSNSVRQRAADDPWRSLGGGVVYELQGLAPHTSVDLIGGCRYLKVVVTSPEFARKQAAYRDWPKVYSMRQFLAFRPAGAGPYRLYWGNPLARERQPASEPVEVPAGEPLLQAKLGSPGPNPSYAFAAAPAAPAVSFREKYKGWIWMAMALLGLAAILMVRRQVRRAKRTFGRDDCHNL